MTLSTILKRSLQIAVLAVPVLALSLVTPLKAFAAVTNAAPEAKISFTFDDGFSSVYTQAAPTLAKYGLTGTTYVPTGCVGFTTAPNTCRAGTGNTYMTWSQIQAMQNTYGWEVGSHTVSHPLLASSDAADGQPNVLTPAEVNYQLSQSKADLAAHGIDAKTIATPYGDYNNAVLAQIAKYYEGHRGFADVSNNIWSYNEILMNNMPVQEGVTVAQVKTRIDQAITNKEWLVLTFHDIKVNPSTDPNDYEYATAKLDQIAAYAQQKAAQIKTINLEDGFVNSTVNALPNGSLANGLAEGWTTNNAASVKADNATNGSYPEATNSIVMNASSSDNFLFTPKVTVDSTQTYMVKSYLNLVSRTSGEIGYYIDEYDANGNWINGQWKKAETTPFVENVNFTYTPSSADVKKASLQVYVTANSGIKAYVDNFEWFSLTGDTTPPVTPPTSTNVMINGTFDAGIASGWTTDKPTSFVTDSANNGAPANPAKAVKMTSGATNAHLFAPRIGVTDSTTYTIKSFANLTAHSTSELGFYVDEYDANGNWISGKYLGATTALGTQTLSFDYTPSSTSVKEASLQVILPGNSGISGFIDNVEWLAPTGTTTPPTTPPTPTNLVANANFDSGIADGWRTDAPLNVVADNTGKGSPNNATNSIKMTSGATSVHLLSPSIVVDSTKSYTLTSYLNLTTITSGEIGYYIDEYDANGNWISGQWKGADNTASTREVTLNYTPSSASVKTASLQIYVMPNSGITAYVDYVRWYQD